MADVYMLFADPLAQAIAEGRKTVTRRPMTARNCDRVLFVNSHIPEGSVGGFADLDWEAHLVPTQRRDGVRTPRGASSCTDRCSGRDYCCTFIDYSGTPEHASYLHVPGKGGETRQRVFCRHSPGDTLIVRECWALVTAVLGVDPYNDGCECQGKLGGVYCPEHDIIEYRAKTGASAPGGWDGVPKDGRPPWGRWTPSIHMPKWAARSRRRIVSITPDRVGVEPLSQEEAEREGFASPADFAAAWDTMYLAKHGPRVWTWRFEFTRENV